MTASKIDHVAMAVPSIERFREESAALFGDFHAGPVIENQRQAVREQFLDDGQTRIELLEPIGDRSPIKAFLERNPDGGLLHLALEVKDIRESIARVEAAGGRLIAGPLPDVAFQERLIAFVLLGGQLTELIESPS